MEPCERVQHALSRVFSSKFINCDKPSLLSIYAYLGFEKNRCVIYPERDRKNILFKYCHKGILTIFVVLTKNVFPVHFLLCKLKT